METKTQTISFAYLPVLMALLLGIQMVVSSAIISTTTTTPNKSMPITTTMITEDNRQQQVISVPTTSGLLLGAKQSLNHQTTGSNNSIYKFLSVPYAEAPIGSLRFKRPVEIKQQERVNSVVDASKFTKTCPQYRHLTQFISALLNIDNEHQISEDCLHLHVYVPSSVGSLDNNNKLEPTKQLPVIVWIPGEGFDFADARQFDGSYLAHKTQSIVVSVQYRVGVLGFLYAPKMNIMGNMGIHDQLMALKWVKQNIAAFGGDSDRVTLMGRFSGSMSISVMVTAPKQDLIKLNNQTLFNRVAMLSGVAVSDWIIDRHQEDRLKELEKEAINKEFCTSSQVNDNTCLEQISTENLLRISDYGWRLVIDDELIGQTSPTDAIKLNQLNSNLEAILIGETGMEGTLCLYRHMLDTKNNYAQIIEEEKLTRKVLHEIIKDDSKTYFEYSADINNKTTNPILDTLKSMAENGNYLRSSSKLRDEYLDACSAYMIKSHSNRFKRNIMARNNLPENRMDSSKKPVEVYHYELKYKPTFSLAPDYIKTAAHGDDIPLIFGLIYNQPRQSINGVDLLMTRKMMAYIGNFVHGNNPLLNQQQQNVVDNDNETTSMDENESINSDENNNYPIQGVLVKSSWSNEGQIHTIDFNKNDLNELSHSKKSQSLNSTPTDGFIESSNVDESASKESSHLRESPRIYLRGDRSNIRVIVIESPQTDVKTTQQSIIDIIERKNHQKVESNGELSATSGGHNQNNQYEQSATKSQRMLELYRQQMVEDNFWIQNSKQRHPLISALPGQQLQFQQQQQPQQQQQVSSAQPATMTLVNESSFMTMLVFSSCIVIFTLISLCLGLCLVIFRSNVTANKGIQHYASTSSSCNICDDSQGSSIEAVLNGHRKDGARGFSNVFEKLRNHNSTRTSSHPQSNQCTSTTSNINNQRTNKTDMVVLTNQQQLSNGVVITNNPQQQQHQHQQGSC